MRFAVTRTSNYRDEVPPCSEAFRGTYEHWDRRTFKSPEEHDARLSSGPGWLDRGSKHRAWEGGIERSMGDSECWFVDLADIPALLAFADKYGDLVFGPLGGNPDVPSIEIYDDYRE